MIYNAKDKIQLEKMITDVLVMEVMQLYNHEIVKSICVSILIKVCKLIFICVKKIVSKFLYNYFIYIYRSMCDYIHTYKYTFGEHQFVGTLLKNIFDVNI